MGRPDVTEELKGYTMKSRGVLLIVIVRMTMRCLKHVAVTTDPFNCQVPAYLSWWYINRGSKNIFETPSILDNILDIVRTDPDY